MAAKKGPLPGTKEAPATAKQFHDGAGQYGDTLLAPMVVKGNVYWSPLHGFLVETSPNRTEVGPIKGKGVAAKPEPGWTQLTPAFQIRLVAR